MSQEPHPELWINFSQEKVAKTSKLFQMLVRNFVSLSIPAQRTDWDVVELIARETQIPIESLCEELSRAVYPRGQVIFDYAGDALDKIANNYDNMEWWVSDAGLNMAVSPALSGRRMRTLEELVLAAFPSPTAPVNGSEQSDTTKPVMDRERSGGPRATALARGRKGDIKLLQKADGSRYETVDFPKAEEYADITPRRRQQLMKGGVLVFTGKGLNRRITVESLIAYCPPADDAK
jgi:hypothetical protein